MIELDPAALAAAIALCEPLNIRTIAFDLCTFDLLKGFQRKLESWLRRDTGAYSAENHHQLRLQTRQLQCFQSSRLKCFKPATDLLGGEPTCRVVACAGVG